MPNASLFIQKTCICWTYPHPPIMRSSQSSWFFRMAIASLCLSFSLFAAFGQCLGNQQTLLLQLKNNLTFNSDASTKLVTWNQNVDCCSWGGITCSDEHVIGLDLADESISNGLDNSSSLFRLSYLQSLNLAYNNFNWSGIPSKLSKLTNLRYLNLSSAEFGGQIPLGISYLTRLVVLDLSDNYYLELKNPNLNLLIQNLSQLEEFYLDSIIISANDNKWCQALSSSLPKLRVLSLSQCALSGPIDSSLENLQLLSFIDLSGNNFGTVVPEFFGDFKNLTFLDLSYSELNGIFPKKIFQVSSLQELYLSPNGLLQGSLPEFPLNGSLRIIELAFTNFFGALPKSIGNLNMLSRINLCGCNFEGLIPKSMLRLKELVFLEMSWNHLSGSIPAFSMAKKLTKIYLRGNNLSGHITSTQWEKLQNLEVLDLTSNFLDGNVPISLFSLPSLKQLVLFDNQFSGQLNEFFVTSSFILEVLDLSSNNLKGLIPKSIFELQALTHLSLSSNNFSGSLELGKTQLRNLLTLNLSCNALTKVEYHGPNISTSPFPQIEVLLLAFNNMKMIPNFLRYSPSLSHLDLSNNQIKGEMPNWISNLTMLQYLYLSHNFLVTLKGPFLGPALIVLDLHSNQFQGSFPTNIEFFRTHKSKILDRLISFSNNMFSGSIPESICNIYGLKALDLSNNLFNGMIPQCLLERNFLGVLNLGTNNLSGIISNVFPNSCKLQILILNGNHLEGELPKSLSNCIKLEILDIGNNNIEGTFPFCLKNASMLKLLVMRSNKFYGTIPHLGQKGTWPLLQIVDVALNNFSGRFPKISFSDWTAMRSDVATSELDYVQYAYYEGPTYDRNEHDLFDNQISVTITNKGLTIKLVKILKIYTSLDFSCNNFDGPIPKEIGELRMLYGLNLSHNAFGGPIPPSLGKLTHLESLDLSSNYLTGTIPMQLVNGLIFLSVLNLSFNQLEGQIPTSKQFATFENSTFEGNKALCGFPLSSNCTDDKPWFLPPTREETRLNSKTIVDWNYISIELGFVFGLGLVILPLMFWKEWRVRYYQCVDNILYGIFPQLYRQNYYRRGAHNNQSLRH